MLEVKLILCPIDFSEFSVRAYRHALSLAEHYRAKVVALHVVELFRFPSAGFAASAGLYDEFCQAAREGGKEQLQEFVKNHTHDEIQPELVVHQGIASDSILAFAQAQKTDVIVMGTHGRRGYDRLMLGSVTNRVIRRAPSPVLVVCKPQHESAAADMAAGKERGRAHRLHRILFLHRFLREFRAGFELRDLRDRRVRRRTHPAARVGGGPKSPQDGRGNSGCDGATG